MIRPPRAGMKGGDEKMNRLFRRSVGQWFLRLLRSHIRAPGQRAIQNAGLLVFAPNAVLAFHADASHVKEAAALLYGCLYGHFQYNNITRKMWLSMVKRKLFFLSPAKLARAASISTDIVYPYPPRSAPTVCRLCTAASGPSAASRPARMQSPAAPSA